MFEGIWLGTNARTEETIIGTRYGVVKCRTVKRPPISERWDAKFLHDMKGTHWQPVPGYQSDHIPVEIRSDGSRPDNQNEDDSVDYKPIIVEEDPGKLPKIHRSRVTGIRVRHADIGKSGATPGCPACEKVTLDKKIPSGMAHSKACIERIAEAIEAQGDLDERVSRAKARKEKISAPVTHFATMSSKELHKERHISKLQKEMHNVMLGLVAEGIDVAEIYSPPRVIQHAAAWGLRPGWSLDITNHDTDGKPWDFSKTEMRNRLW